MTLARLHNGHVLGAAAFLALPATVFSPPFVAPILIAAALAALALSLREQSWPSAPRGLFLLLVAVVAYGTLSMAWSINPRLSFVLAARLFGEFVAGLVLLDAARRLSAAERDFFARAFLAGFVLGLALLTFEIATAASMIRFLREQAIVKDIIGPQRPLYLYSYFNRVATLVGLIAWPAALVLGRRAGWLWGAVLALAAFAPVLMSDSETAKLAYGTGIVVWLAARLVPRRAALVLGILIALGVVTAPLVLRSSVIGWAPGTLAPSDKESSLAHRVAIWDFTYSAIRKRPYFGWGLDSSRVIPGAHATFARNAELLPLHPHDMALQLWLELGVFGALWGAAFALYVTRAIAGEAPRPAAQATLLAMVAAAAINASAGYDLWHPWWLSFLWLSASFAVAALPSAERRHGTD
jgi:O-antigen ligase